MRYLAIRSCCIFVYISATLHQHFTPFFVRLVNWPAASKQYKHLVIVSSFSIYFRNLTAPGDHTKTMFPVSEVLPSDYKGVVDITLQLPPSLLCSQCVIQWFWYAGKCASHNQQKHKFYNRSHPLLDWGHITLNFTAAAKAQAFQGSQSSRLVKNLFEVGAVIPSLSSVLLLYITTKL